MRLVFKLVMQIADWPAKCVCESLYWCSMGHHWNVSSGPCGAVTDIYCPLLMMPFKYVARQKRLPSIIRRMPYFILLTYCFTVN